MTEINVFVLKKKYKNLYWRSFLDMTILKNNLTKLIQDFLVHLLLNQTTNARAGSKFFWKQGKESVMVWAEIQGL